MHIQLKKQNALHLSHRPRPRHQNSSQKQHLVLLPFGNNGGAGERGLRTSFGIKLVLGLPLAQHNLAPFVAAPFQFTWRSSGPKGLQNGNELAEGLTPSHPILKVFGWQKRLAEDRELTKAQIGEQEGLSKARMTQMFSLLHLPKSAQEYLADLTAPELIKAFSVRQLMVLAKMPTSQRSEAFVKMRTDCERHAHCG
jgi:hypothetical protein